MVGTRRQPTPPRDHLGIFEGGKGRARAFTETVAIESLLLHHLGTEAVTSASTTAVAAAAPPPRTTSDSVFLKVSIASASGAGGRAGLHYPRLRLYSAD